MLDTMFFALGLREKQSVIFRVMVGFIRLHVDLASRIACTSFGCLSSWDGLASHQVVDIGAIGSASTSATTTSAVLKLYGIAAQGHRLNLDLPSCASRFGRASWLRALPLMLARGNTTAIDPCININNVFLNIRSEHGVALIRLRVNRCTHFIDKR